MKLMRRTAAILLTLAILLCFIPTFSAVAATAFTHTQVKVDYRSTGGSNGLDCRRAMYFGTDSNDPVATNTLLYAVEGAGGLFHNGTRVTFHLQKAAPSLYYVNCASTPFEVGDRVMLAGTFADKASTYSITFPTTVFEYMGVSANGKGWWKIVDLASTDYLTLSDFGITSDVTVGNSSQSGAAGSIAGKDFTFYSDMRLSTGSNQFLLLFYGATAKGYWDGYRIGFRSDGVLVVHNITSLVGYESSGAAASSTILGAVSLSSLGIDLSEKVKITLHLDYVDFDNDGQKDDSRLSVKLNDVTAIAAATLVDALGVLGNGALFYSEGNGTQTISNYRVELPKLALTDFGIAYGTYGNQGSSVSGTYAGDVFGKQLTFKALTNTTVHATDATQIYYGASAKGQWNGFQIQLRGNGSIVIFNQIGAATTYTVIYLERECGVAPGTPYTLGLTLTLVDFDGDGSRDDVHLSVTIDGVEYKGDTPSSNNAINGLYTMGSSMLIYGQAGNTTTFSASGEAVVTDRISASLSDGVLTVSGTGTVKAEDLQAAVTDPTAVSKVKIEAGVTGIDSETFVGYTALTEVHTPNTLLTVAEDAFVGCASGVTLRYVADKPYVGGLVNADVHPYYSFKIVTIGSSYGEDTNTYIYKLAKTYYASLAGRKEGDSAYDEIVVAELYTGGGTLAQRVQAINGTPNASAYYEKWNDAGISIPTSPSGQLSAGLMRMALRDEYWDYVMLMQSAADSANAASFTASTSGNGEADIDVVIDFAKQNNRFGENSKYVWLQTWSYNEKLANGNYAAAVTAEKNMRAGIANAMQTVVQSRVDSGVLDAIVPAGAAIENLKTSVLNREDPTFDHSSISATRKWNDGVYSNYFAIQRDTAHASCGLGRFTLGLTAFSFIAGLTDLEIGRLSQSCYPRSLADYEISDKLYSEETATGGYLAYDTLTAECALQAYSAAVSAIHNPYADSLVCMTGDINNDGAANALDIVRYKRAAAGEDTFLDSHSADVNVDGNRDKTDLGILRKELL